MDMGDIAMVNRNYRSTMLSQILSTFHLRTQHRQDAEDTMMTAGTIGLNQGYRPHVYNVMNVLAIKIIKKLDVYCRILPATSLPGTRRRRPGI
jgi:hypothetical protein